MALIRSIIKLFEEPAGKAMLDICRIKDSGGRKSTRRVFREALCRSRYLVDRAIDRGEWSDRVDRMRLLELVVARIYLRALVTEECLRVGRSPRW